MIDWAREGAGPESTAPAGAGSSGRRVPVRTYRLSEYSRFMMPRARDVYIQSAARLPRRLTRTKPRSEAEQRLLTRQVLRLWHRAVDSGRLEVLGPRIYRLNIAGAGSFSQPPSASETPGGRQHE